MNYQMNDIKWNSIKWFFDRLWESPDKFPDFGVLLVLNEKEIRRVLNANRIELLQKLLKNSSSMSLIKIAEKVQRPEIPVSKDLKIMEKIALVERDELGNWKAKEAIILREVELKIKHFKETEETILEV